MPISPSDPRGSFEFFYKAEDLIFCGTAPEGSPNMRIHLSFEVQNGEHGYACQFAEFRRKAAAPQNGTIGEGKGPLCELGIPSLDFFEKDLAELAVNLFEGSSGGKGFGLIKGSAVQDGGHALAGCESQGKAQIGTAEEDGFTEPLSGGPRRNQDLSDSGELVQMTGCQSAHPTEKVPLDRGSRIRGARRRGSRGRGAGRRDIHFRSIALCLALPLLLFGCKKGTPIPGPTRPAKARLLGVSYGKDPLKLPDGRRVSRARFQGYLVETRAKPWLFLKAFLAARARDGKVASLEPGLREDYRKVLAEHPDAQSFLPEPNGKWRSWSALDDLVSATLLFRDKDEEADFGRKEAARRAFRRMSRAYRQGNPSLLYIGDTLFCDWEGARAPASLCYPDILALLTPPQRDQALLELADRIKTRQAPGAGR